MEIVPTEEKSNFVIDTTEYDRVSNFCEGLTAVSKSMKWGFIDKKGNVVVPLIYDEVSPFSEELAMVKKDDKCGFIAKPVIAD